MSMSLLDSFGLDHAFRAKVRPLLLVLPIAAGISYGVMYLTGGAKLAVQVLVAASVTNFSAMTLLGVCAKGAGMLNLPFVSFSDMPGDGQRLLLFLFGLFFLGLGICFGLGFYGVLHT